ncbi:uncharacterized protein MONOS_6378 [Monocercomonoides exilis]|uniref:uncharacterized protein n=1 Tax=Monocercomonoides exilis TaxID=2049356 RepID=UPI00355AAFD9|nr:hypothetical protein MONOS_6378 [Monocercomonoides exilis]|eukprot:MONOS_6378.1-p1 / transcript=MONOS_6378.1 / gene=MONOS_6378 / organism=Monocercomonoides_exilis_PA203 / gene_product=unspecified product / transcript_product=unspecified product / location=Mono_scaffold00200:32575-35536(-) / protein_length=699 / sequence_SO=supercontig / SO=protein_coding / is_pseudo=false
MSITAEGFTDTLPLEERYGDLLDVYDPRDWLHRYDQPGTPQQWKDFTNPINNLRFLQQSEVDSSEAASQSSSTEPSSSTSPSKKSSPAASRYGVHLVPQTTDVLICPLCKKKIENPFPGQPINWHIQICWACGRYCCESCSNIVDLTQIKLKKGEQPPSPLELGSCFHCMAPLGALSTTMKRRVDWGYRLFDEEGDFHSNPKFAAALCIASECDPSAIMAQDLIANKRDPVQGCAYLTRGIMCMNYVESLAPTLINGIYAHFLYRTHFLRLSVEKRFGLWGKECNKDKIVAEQVDEEGMLRAKMKEEKEKEKKLETGKEEKAGEEEAKEEMNDVESKENAESKKEKAKKQNQSPASSDESSPPRSLSASPPRVPVPKKKDDSKKAKSTSASSSSTSSSSSEGDEENESSKPEWAIQPVLDDEAAKEEERKILSILITKKPDAFQSKTSYFCALSVLPSGYPDPLQLPFRSLYIDMFSLPNGIQLIRDDRFSRHLICRCCTGNARARALGILHRGLMSYLGHPKMVMMRIMDIRWVFETEEGAEQYIRECHDKLTEGQKAVRGMKDIGKNFTCVGGPKASRIHDIPVPSYAFIFRIGRVVLKIYAAQGPESTVVLDPSALSTLSKIAAAKAAMLKFPSPEHIQSLIAQRDADGAFGAKLEEKVRREGAKKSREQVISQHVSALTSNDPRELASLPKAIG